MTEIEKLNYKLVVQYKYPKNTFNLKNYHCW